MKAKKKHQKRHSNYVHMLGEDLIRYYIDENMTLTEIAEIYHCDRNTVRNRLIEFDIPIKRVGRYKGIRNKQYEN